MSVNNTAPTSDTEVKEVDTSTNEETQDTDFEETDDVSFDDVDTGFDEETEESEETDKDESANESFDESEEESKEDEGNQSPDEDAKEDRTASEDDAKRRNHEMAQKRIAEREARKAKQQEDYLNGATDERDMALRQLQVDAYNNRIEMSVSKITTGIDRAVADIPEFTKGSPEVQEALMSALDDFDRMHIQRDKNGDPIGVTGDVYQFLQAKANSIRKLTGVGARQESRNKANQRARTMVPTSRAPKPAPKDDLLDAFDEEAGRW